VKEKKEGVRLKVEISEGQENGGTTRERGRSYRSKTNQMKCTPRKKEIAFQREKGKEVFGGTNIH